MSAAKQRGRWQGGDAADSAEVWQGAPNAASGILIAPLNRSRSITSQHAVQWGSASPQ